jgi:deoxyribodipyrimidine photo-lyase
MNKPFKPTFANIAWSNNATHLAAWQEGRTGYPLVDAAMRQLRYTGWLPNRSRMIAASFLAKHLLIDWRLGEQYFRAHLVDGDVASNAGGWGWAIGAGPDPNPWFRILSPDRQAARFDPGGNYVRAWVAELREVGVEGGKEMPRGKGREKEKGKGSRLHPIHDPYRLGWADEVARAGYPRRIVEHDTARAECLRCFKEGLGMDFDEDVITEG